MSRRSVSAWLLLLAAAVLLSAVGGCDASEGPARKLLQPGRGRDRGQAADVQADGVLPSSSPSPSPVVEAGQLPTLPALTKLNTPPDTPTAEENADKLGQRRNERSNDAQPQAKADKPEGGQPKVESPSVEQPKAQQRKAEQPGRGRAGDMFDTDSLLKQSGRGQGQDNKGEKQQDKKDEKQQDKKEEKKVQEDAAKVELPAVVTPPKLNLPNVELPAAAEGKKEDGPANNKKDQAAPDNKPAEGDTASIDKKERTPSDKKEEAAIGKAIPQDQAADNKDQTTADTPDKQEVAPADEKEQDDKAEATPEVVTKKIDKALSTPSTASVESAATAIAKAGSKGRGSASVEAAASSIIRRFERGDGDDKQDAVAEAFAASAARDAAATAVVFAKAAAGARRRGFERQFGRQCARGFVKARSRGSIETYTIAISKAIVDEDDDDVVQAYGVAFAEAVASGGEESDALAEATAIAFCKGGSTATAFAKAFDVALERDRNGCLVLTKVRALAVARCSNGFVRTYAEASVERKVLGFCGILEQFGIFNFGLDWDRLRRFGGHRK